VLEDILEGTPEWITDFPDDFVLRCKGEDPQTGDIAVAINSFSRPVLRFTIRPRKTGPLIAVFVCHFKSKGPTQIWRESWYDKDIHGPHRDAIGGALSTIRRTAEATALRMILTREMKGTDTPVVVIGDLNDGQHSNTLNILSGQPRFLTALAEGGGDTDLYTAQTLQQYRSQTDVYYTHIYQDTRESLDHILVSQEFYDNSRRRIWAFDGLTIANDHLNDDATRKAARAITVWSGQRSNTCRPRLFWPEAASVQQFLVADMRRLIAQPVIEGMGAAAAFVCGQLHHARAGRPGACLYLGHQGGPDALPPLVLCGPHRLDQRARHASTRQAVQNGQLTAGHDLPALFGHDDLVHRLGGDPVESLQISLHPGGFAPLAKGIIGQKRHKGGHILARGRAKDHCPPISAGSARWAKGSSPRG
jgi:hypothetical protein